MSEPVFPEQLELAKCDWARGGILSVKVFVEPY